MAGKPLLGKLDRARAAEVLAIAQRLARSEEERLAKLAEGIPLSEFAAIPRKE